MIVVPVGIDQDTVSRQPVVTYALLALNVLIFIVVAIGFSEEEWERELKPEFQAIADYVDRHPDIDFSSQTRKRLPSSLLRKLQHIRKEASDEGSGAGESLRKLEEEELDGLAQQLLKTFEKNPTYRYALKGRQPTVTTLLTSMFLHGGVSHLFGNMLFLFVAAPFIEDLYGHGIFMLLYLGSGAAAAGLQLLKAPSGAMIGASGAIAGVMGAFLVRLFKRRVRFFFFTLVFYRPVKFYFHVPAYVLLPFWFLNESISAELLARDGIGHWAHVGGFVFGAGVAVVIMVFGIETRLWKRSERPEESDSPEEMDVIAAPAQPAEPPAAEARASKAAPPPLLLADPGELMTLFRHAERALRSRRLQQARELFTRALSHPTCTDVWRERVEARLAEIDQASRFGQFPD